jgi:hypothetical protein
MDVAALEDLLREAEEHHGAYDAIAPKHDWSSWYASYISSRGKGNTPERGSTDAGLYTEYVAPDRARRRARAWPSRANARITTPVQRRE